MNLLDRLQLSFRCPADWEAMEGDETKRFCSHCQKHVHNLSAMTREEAEAVATRSGEICVRMTRRADGTTVTKGCPKTVAVRTKAVRLAGAGMAAGGALVLASCDKPVIGDVKVPDEVGEAEPEEEVELLGDVVVPEEIEVPEPALMGLMCPQEEID